MITHELVLCACIARINAVPRTNPRERSDVVERCRRVLDYLLTR